MPHVVSALLSRLRLILIAAALLALVAACGEDPEPAAEPDDDPADVDDVDEPDDPDVDEVDEPEGEPEVSDVTVGLIPIVNLAPLALAEQEGYFEEEGLTVNSEFGIGGAAIVPALIAGDLQFGFGNYISTFQAIQEGFDIVVIAEANRAVPGFSRLTAMDDSPIQEPADLEGALISVNAVGSIGGLFIESVLDHHGVDYESIEYTEVPFGEVGAALERGDIDAGWTSQPHGYILDTELGARMVLDTNDPDGPTAGIPVSGFTTTSAFAEENPNTVAAFARAISRGSELASQDEQAVRDALIEALDLDPDIAHNMVPLPEYPVETSVSELQRIADLMLEYGYMDEPLDVSTVVR